jgi:beta-glucosidase-like glycosyl hydrolase
MSVMASYNEIDGIPSHANRWLLRDVLRKEWGFKGFIVSDYYAITELNYRADVRGHAVAPDKKEACRLAVEAGVNIELPEPDCYLHLVELVRKGVLKERQLDDLVAPMLHCEIPAGPVRRPLCRSRRRRCPGGLRRPSPTGAASRAPDHHPAQERKQPGAALARRHQDHRRHRTQRQPQHAGRL